MFDEEGRPGGDGIKFKPPANMIGLTVLAVVISIAIFIGLTSFFTVQEQERAVVTTFGKAEDSKVYGAGLHFKFPLAQNMRKVDMTTKGMPMGYATVDNKDLDVADESIMITRDFNLVVIDFYIEWRVNDPIKYIYAAEEPIPLLKHIVQSSARSIVSAYDVDEVLTTAKGEIQTRVKEYVTTKLDQYDIGIMISNITVQDAEPPTEEITLAFKDVENAKQQKDTEINLANQYENTEIPYARSEADRLIKEAESVRESRINEAAGQVQRFNDIFKEYQNNPNVTRTRMYLEAMEEIMPDIKVVIESSNSDTLKILNLDNESAVNNQ